NGRLAARCRVAGDSGSTVGAGAAAGGDRGATGDTAAVSAARRTDATAPGRANHITCATTRCGAGHSFDPAAAAARVSAVDAPTFHAAQAREVVAQSRRNDRPKLGKLGRRDRAAAGDLFLPEIRVGSGVDSP